MTTALVLAGHGSHITPETAGLVWKQVDSLRALDVADEVTAAFWKEQPSFATVLTSLTADDITIVPLFTAQGYFTQTVIPAEMRLTGSLTRRSNRIMRYTRTLSEHPYLSNIVRQRIEDVIQQINASPDQIAVAIIGHSTRRNPESRKATEAQAEKIRALNRVAEVQAVYLDDSPGISDIYALTQAPNIIAVPYFLTQGSHTTIDVPQELGLLPGATSGIIYNRTVYYTAAVGIEDGLQTAILDLARESGAPLFKTHLGSDWEWVPSRGAGLLIKTILSRGMFRFGDLRLDAYEISTWNNPGGNFLPTLSAIRDHIRINPFRSLATARNLSGNWHFRTEHPEMLHAVTETIYPGAVADWASHKRGTFYPTPFASVIARQTGNFRRLAKLNINQQSEVVRHICVGCVRHPTWFIGTSPEDAIPCREPCNHWLSAALEHTE